MIGINRMEGASSSKLLLAVILSAAKNLLSHGINSL